MVECEVIYFTAASFTELVDLGTAERIELVAI